MSANNPRLALARAILAEPWTSGALPPTRERGEERERRQIRLPARLWATLAVDAG